MGRPVKVQIFSIAPKKPLEISDGFCIISLVADKGGFMNDTLSDYDKAMQVINDLSKEYEKWSAADLERLTEAYDQAFYAPSGERERLIREDVFRTAHDMKGQGATFNYGLVTDIANHLCRYIERQTDFQEKQLNDIGLHITFLREIIEKKLTGDGGERGTQIWKIIQELS